MIFPGQHYPQIAFIVLGALLFGLLFLFRPAARSLARRLLHGLIYTLALVSLLAYFRFFQFHPYPPFGSHAYHYPDAYHYYIGAKYYPEVGTFGIYDSTLIALEELRAAGVRAPRVDWVRDLEDQVTLQSRAQVLSHKDLIKRRFSPARWAAFQADIRFLALLPMGLGGMPPMLYDMGFNSPPTWNAVAHPLARLIPLNNASFEAMGFIDQTLLLLVGGWMLWRAFGPLVVAGCAILFGNNWIAAYDWTGGSFLRLTWLALLVTALAALKRERWLLAGVLLGLATADRLWPASPRARHSGAYAGRRY